MSTKQIVKAIQTALEAEGVYVFIHPAVTTSSIYLAFDGGVLKMARVGDHKGLGYNYTYEIGKHVLPPYEVAMTFKGSKYTRYRYREDQVADLVTQVLVLRSNLRAKYGKERYEAFRSKALSDQAFRNAGRKMPMKGKVTRIRVPQPTSEAVAADELFTYNQQMEAMGPDFDPNGFSTY